MIDIFIRFALWTLAIGAVFFYMAHDPRRPSGLMAKFDGGPGIIGILGAALFMLLLAGCAAPAVLSTPNSCATLLPNDWKEGVPGAPLPSGDTVGDWISFADAQTGKLDQANGRTRDAISIVERCEARDAAAVRKATRRWWQIF